MKLKLRFLLITLLLLVSSLAAFSQGVQPQPASSPVIRGYQLGPGDEITATVLGEKDFDFVAVVNEDGLIEVPFYDKPIVAKCKTDRELKAEVVKLLGKYIRSPQVNLRITAQKSRPPATIYGEVKTPQQYELHRKATLVELLAFSGGPTEEAAGEIQIFRTHPPICSDSNDAANWTIAANDPTQVPSRVYSLADVRTGKEDPVIYPGDVIVVQKAAPIYITGEVVAPQGIYLKEGGLSLTEAIAKVGGVKREAKTKEIRIYRLKPKSSDREIISANFEEIKRGTQRDLMLQPQDIVEVDKAKDSIAKTILEFAIGAGKTLVTSGASGVGYRVIY